MGGFISICLMFYGTFTYFVLPKLFNRKISNYYLKQNTEIKKEEFKQELECA